MNNTMGIICHYKKEGLLKELTQCRCMAAVPYGGRYRLIDFMLSNLVNGGVRNIAVFTSLKFRSLVNHLGQGKEWGLDRKKDGLFFLPCAQEESMAQTCSFDLKDLAAHLDYLERSRQKYVVLAGSNVVLNFDLARVLNTHREKRAQLTVLYKEGYFPGEKEVSQQICLATGKDGRVKELKIDCFPGLYNKVALGVYILEKSLLADLIKNCEKTGEGDLVQCALKDSSLQIFGYPHPGYGAMINSLAGYYRHQKELLEPEIRRDLFGGPRPIITSTKDGPPTMYCRGSQVKNSLLANSCVIAGRVENSILFRGVRVAAGAVVKDSIIMSRTLIGEEAHVEGVILDKGVWVRPGAILMGDEDKQLVISKKSVI